MAAQSSFDLPLVARILFITGTDTGVGKTTVSVLLTRQLLALGRSVRAVKPFCSGGRDDALALYQAQGGRVPLNGINPWHFEAPLTPLLAARREGHRITLTQAARFLRTAAEQSEFLVVEGAGGLLSPLGEGFSARELITRVHATPVVVCPDRLGAINQARLVFAALPAKLRRRAELVLVRPAIPDGSTRTNASILIEFFGKGHIHRLGWLKQSALQARVPTAIRQLAAKLGPTDPQSSRSPR